MDVISLVAESRIPGKRGARAARRQGAVPCVLYGQRVDSVPFAVSEKSLGPLIYTNETHLVEIKIEDSAWQCILKEIAYHPVTDRPLHADFQVLRAGSKVTLTVPVRFNGIPEGQVKGGTVSVVVNELIVSCLPKHIPSQIDVDVTHVEIGDSIHLGDLDFEDLEFQAPDDQILMVVERPRLEEVEPTEEEETEEELPEAEEE